MRLILFWLIASSFSLAATVAQPFPAQVAPITTGQVEEFINDNTNRLMPEVFDSEDTSNRFISPYDAIANMPHNIGEFEHASGNWLGGRDFLDSHGVEFSMTYTSDIAGNPVGGKVPGGFTYADNFALGCLLETEKLFRWPGGYFMMSVLERDGNSLSRENIDNQFKVQQVYGGQTFHWYELSYQQDLFNDHASLKVGRLGAGDDFAVSPLYWLYMNNGIDGTPQAIPVNSKSSCYPNAVWASRLKIDVTSTTVARLGIYQVTPFNSIHGLNWDFYPSNGVMLLGQYSWNPEFLKPENRSTTTIDKNVIFQSPTEHDTSDKTKLHGLSGHYWMGGYYSTMEYSQFNSNTMTPNAYGLYWHADQMIYRVDPLMNKGLVLWSAYVLSPQENISKVPFQASGGAIYTGLLPGRENDASILGFVYGNFSTLYASAQEATGAGRPNYELAYEAGYRINLTKFAYIQPDLQWIINPGGLGSRPNALVLGAQMGLIF